MTLKKTSGGERREKLRREFWPADDAWTGVDEKGWFRAPRTLPLILSLLGSKALSENSDPTKVYLELLARHVDEGVVEMGHEGDHAYAAGYFGSRAVRTWQERMRILEKNGFIKTKLRGSQGYKYVLLVHPTIAIQRLRAEGKVPEQWWEAYRARQIETKEASYEQRQSAKREAKVVAMTPKSVGRPNDAKKKRPAT